MVPKQKKSVYNKTYYDKNKSKILEKMKIKVECGCGSVLSKGNVANHKKSKKHIDWIKKNVSETSN